MIHSHNNISLWSKAPQTVEGNGIVFTLDQYRKGGGSLG
jgi:hypothetical protein